MSKAVAYGSLYIDEGEKLKFAKRQVRKILKPKRGQEIVGLWFDVCGWEEQKEQANGIIADLGTWVKREYPYLEEVHIGFSSNEKTGERPRREP